MNENIPIIDFRAKLKSINKSGFIKTLRKGPTGIGKTLETLFGIPENNKADHDLEWKREKIELKSRRKKAGSRITLTTKEGVKGIYSDKFLLGHYGYRDTKGRIGLKVTIYADKINKKGFRLLLDEEFIYVVKDGKCLWNWSIGKLKNKYQNLLLVSADSIEKNGEEHFHFNKAIFYSGFSKIKFLENLKSGKIVLEFRMHIKENGSVRNHGTGFRVAEKYLPEFYEKVETIL